jgi:hypothetical protein
LREQVGSAARLIEKGVVCWLHTNRGLLQTKAYPHVRKWGQAGMALN